MAQAKNILIVGPPRSGTSLTAAALARNGYFVGSIERDELREGNENNPFGFFEADRVIAHNVEVLRACGFAHHNTWKFAEIEDASVRCLEDLPPRPEDQRLLAEYEDRTPWLWKDPRLCYTLSYWWRLVDPGRTGVVLVRRDVAEIHNSFVRMNWCGADRDDAEACRRRVRRHIETAETIVRRLKIPHISLDYSTYLEDPIAAANVLSQFCGTPILPESLNVRRELNHATRFGRVRSRLRRSLDSGWLRHARVLRPLVPKAVVAAVLPEKRLVAKKPPSSSGPPLLRVGSNGRCGSSPAAYRIPVVITVDVEPDDVWSNHLSRSLSNVPQLLRLQGILDRFNAPATLLATSTVVSDRASREVLHRLAGESGAEIGSHLHPWETEPFLENGNDRRFAIYPHELPLPVFTRKMERLTEEIERYFGQPVSYRAGRWGLAEEHLPVLEQLGYQVDTSVTPLVDWSKNPGLPLDQGGRGGPNYLCAPRSAHRPGVYAVSRTSPRDWTAGGEKTGRIWEIPVTTGFMRRVPGAVWAAYGRLPALARRGLCKSGVLRPVACVPPRESKDHLLRMVRATLSLGASHVNITFHSSELQLGGSARTRTSQQLEAVFQRIECLLTLLAENGACEFGTLRLAAERIASRMATSRRSSLSRSIARPRRAGSPSPPASPSCRPRTSPATFAARAHKSSSSLSSA